MYSWTSGKVRIVVAREHDDENVEAAACQRECAEVPAYERGCSDATTAMRLGLLPGRGALPKPWLSLEPWTEGLG